MSGKETARGAVKSMREFLICAERGEKLEKPFSGRFVVRLEPVFHRKVAIAAARSEQSINSWVSKVLERAVAAELNPVQMATNQAPSETLLPKRRQMLLHADSTFHSSTSPSPTQTMQLPSPIHSWHSTRCSSVCFHPCPLHIGQYRKSPAEPTHPQPLHIQHGRRMPISSARPLPSHPGQKPEPAQ